jgi:hypothetical protein
MLASCTESHNTNPRNYNEIVDPVDKISKDLFISKIFPSSMHTNLRLSDLVVSGNVIGTKEATFCIMHQYSEEEIERGILEISPSELTYTFSVFKVKEALRGDIEGREVVGGEEIYVLLENYKDLLFDGENLILFVGSLFDEGFVGYVPVDGEHSIFAYEDGGRERLYSFSNTEELSAFDGKQKSELFDVVRTSDAFNIEGNPYRTDR